MMMKHHKNVLNFGVIGHFARKKKILFTAFFVVVNMNIFVGGRVVSFGI